MVHFQVRKMMVFSESIFHENGPPPETPRHRGAIVAVVSNPFAGIWPPVLSVALAANRGDVPVLEVLILNVLELTPAGTAGVALTVNVKSLSVSVCAVKSGVAETCKLTFLLPFPVPA